MNGIKIFDGIFFTKRVMYFDNLIEICEQIISIPYTGTQIKLKKDVYRTMFFTFQTR